MTSTNDDTPPRQPDENKKKPLDHPDRDVLDFIDETVARITDAEVEEHLHFIDEIAGRPTAEIGKHFFCARPYIIRILLNSDSVTIHSAWEPVGTVMPRFTKQDRSQATPLNRIHGLHAAAALGEFAPTSSSPNTTMSSSPATSTPSSPNTTTPSSPTTTTTPSSPAPSTPSSPTTTTPSSPTTTTIAAPGSGLLTFLELQLAPGRSTGRISASALAKPHPARSSPAALRNAHQARSSASATSAASTVATMTTRA